MSDEANAAKQKRPERPRDLPQSASVLLPPSPDGESGSTPGVALDLVSHLEAELAEADAEIEKLSRRHTQACDRNWGTCTCERLESQNQALQERLDRQEVYISKEIPALQERAEKAERERDEALRYIGRPRNAPSYTTLQEALRAIEAGPYNGFEQCRAIARNALSPTQETDPE